MSNKTVIELGCGDKQKNTNPLTENIPIETSFEFWSRKQQRNVTKLSNKKITETNEFFELHAQLNLLNVDVTDWNEDTLV